ncbi:uncharacterized protein BKCO1_4200057 [Diplodia corticola]|uniref:Uncharacterized protein n=1 Tax=Diplodia corticola TaxID=236234 RepID=A0A1J9QUB2_9PEZI|nr:uncharacterized protein BKCO1_4200057 [Diplodia corticola]OJD31993.1 hypothetical protein BKCO1_4200057 [Diplodia corticola]
MASSAAQAAQADICWGTSKKTNRRCANKAKLAPPGHLPTCHQHRDQLLRPGCCQYLVNAKTAARCKRRFVYDPPPPYLELCPEHADTPQGPCHFLRLPVELRIEVYKYFLQPGAVCGDEHQAQTFRPFLPLLLVNKQVGSEAQDHLYACTTFHVEIGQQGATINGRYLYRPCGAEYRYDDEGGAVVNKYRDIRQQLNFSRVKNFNLEVSVVNCSELVGWSEEVEMYDLRDSISAILPYLARARSLNKLNVRVVCTRFDRWTPAKALANFKLITQPLMSLRNVMHPLLEPPYKGLLWFPSNHRNSSKRHLPTSTFADITTPDSIADAPLPPSWSYRIAGRFIPPTSQQANTYAEFLSYKRVFESITASAEPVPPKPPIARMFSAFKRVYLECASLILSPNPANSAHSTNSTTNSTTTTTEPLPFGASNYLHRARVARENADLDAFVAARNGFVRRWNTHLEQRYRELARVNGLVVDMYNVDAVGCCGMGPWDAQFTSSSSSGLEGAGAAGGDAAGSVAGLAAIQHQHQHQHQQQHQQQQQRQLASPPAECGPVGLTANTVLQMSGGSGSSSGGDGRMVGGARGSGSWVAGWDWNYSAAGTAAGGGGGGGRVSACEGVAPDCDGDVAMVLKEEEGAGYGEGSMQFASGFR